MTAEITILKIGNEKFGKQDVVAEFGFDKNRGFINSVDHGKEQDTTEEENELLNADRKIILVPVESLPKQAPNSNCDFGNTGSFKWWHELVKQLISERKKLSEKFDNSTIKKKKLWDEIGRKLSITANFPLTGEVCDKKWRALTQRYRIIKEKQMKGGECNVGWNYYQEFESFFLSYNNANSLKVLNGGISSDEFAVQQTSSSTSSRRSSERSDISSACSATSKDGSDEEAFTNPYVSVKRKFSGTLCRSRQFHLGILKKSRLISEQVKQRKLKLEEPPTWFKIYMKKHDREQREQLEETRAFREKFEQLEERKIEQMQRLNDILAHALLNK